MCHSVDLFHPCTLQPVLFIFYCSSLTCLWKEPCAWATLWTKQLHGELREVWKALHGLLDRSLLVSVWGNMEISEEVKQFQSYGPLHRPAQWTDAGISDPQENFWLSGMIKGSHTGPVGGGSYTNFIITSATLEDCFPVRPIMRMQIHLTPEKPFS
jgi:hypothetical protein